MDWVITSTLDALDELHLLDNTLVLITNDHGEMVGDDAEHLLGHGWKLRPDLCNTPLIIMNPGFKGFRVNYTLGSQVDVLPTLLDLLDIARPADAVYQGVSLYDATANLNKRIYLSSYVDRAIVTESRFLLEERDHNQSPAEHRPVKVFEIRNDGVRTLFQPTTEPVSISQTLDEFEEFQNSFIVHYSHYKQIINQRGRGQPISTAAH
jgi:arylsulfatase A-like enzyme